MSEKVEKKYIVTALALYFTFFIHGIGVSILAQYKNELAGAWGGNLGAVLQVSAALGLGRLISLPISGPISDKFGRRITAIIGIGFYTAFFFGIAKTSSVTFAYILGILGGVANSFLDTAVIPAVLEIFEEKGDMATMFTKFSMSLGQFILPFAIGVVSSKALGYETLFYLAGILLIIDGILILFLPFPKIKGKKSEAGKEKMVFTSESLALVLLGFTTTATFVLWLNANQELSLLYGVEDPSMIQSLYAFGTFCAVLFSSFVMLRKFKAVDVLVIYPFISLITLIGVYFIRTPLMVKIAGFSLGFFAAGGVLQLVTSTANYMFPENKGKITSIVMMASSLGNYLVLTIAGKLTDKFINTGPVYVVLFNILITLIGVLLAIYVNKRFKEIKLNS